MLIGVFSASMPLFAQTSDSEACDSDVQSVMNARARLEAMRQMEMAQALILKPDSVLEYSCFDDRLNELGASMNMMFSGNVFNRSLFSIPPQQWDAGEDSSIRIMPDKITAPNTGQQVLLPGPNPPGGPLSGHGIRVLGDLVYNAMFEFLVQNYSHVYAGGTFSDVPSGSLCNPMDLVWKFLKCRDMNADLFLTFEEIVSKDPRSLVVNPAELPICAVADRPAVWQAALEAARPAPGSAGSVETVVKHKAMFDSSQCSSVSPILTGVKVVQTLDGQTKSFDDAVCPAAGCMYDGGGKCI